MTERKIPPHEVRWLMGKLKELWSQEGVPLPKHNLISGFSRMMVLFKHHGHEPEMAVNFGKRFVDLYRDCVERLGLSPQSLSICHRLVSVAAEVVRDYLKTPIP